jgi:hypothetical protein
VRWEICRSKCEVGVAGVWGPKPHAWRSLLILHNYNLIRINSPFAETLVKTILIGERGSSVHSVYLRSLHSITFPW